MDASPLRLTFEGGTIAISGAGPEITALPGCQHDPRTGAYRAEARWYRPIVEQLLREKIPYQDDARAYQPTPWPLKTSREPFPHQTEALETWWKQRGRGVVVLPTGTGKTHVAILAIHKAGRPAMVITPTIDLLNQWYNELLLAFDVPVGLIGGGHYELQPLTVTTYDSAFLYLERWGNRFGLLIFDECHHLPGPSYQYAAIGSLAPYRLGLTATPERADGQDVMLPELIGPIVYRKEIREFSADYLAKYQVEKCFVDLSPEEQQRYQQAREQYRRFVEERGISMGAANGWRRFLQETYRSAEGRAAFQAYREQKKIAQAAPAKLRLLEQLLALHRLDRVLVFTADN